MNIVLVSIGNFQSYILDNIRNLIHLKHNNIYVIINQNFYHHFSEFNPQIIEDNVNDSISLSSPVKLIYVENLKDDFHCYERTRLDKSFNNGFWVMTSLRIFYIYAFMAKYHIEDVIHIENDVVLYYNCDILLQHVDRTKIYVPFNSYSINVISILYIPTAELIKNLLVHWNFDMLDMNVFAIFKHIMPNSVDTFPICKQQPEFIGDNMKLMVCQNFTRFGMVFDGNAMGQYLGGIDPQNVGNSTKSTDGYVNKDCCIKYNQYKFIWKRKSVVDISQDINDTMKKPILCIGDDEIPIFNLHIHSKNLTRFIGGAGFIEEL